MKKQHLYNEIAEHVRQQIMEGSLQPGERLQPVRQMAQQWDCTIGTVQRAYQELARSSLVTLSPGRGTRVVDQPKMENEAPLRRAGLIHQSEAFLLEMITAGHDLEAIENAIRVSMDRWRTVEMERSLIDMNNLRFAGSHDLAIAWLAGQFADIAPGNSLQLSFTGSLGGLMALVEGRADIAGSHLWDEDSGLYNVSYVQQLMPGKRMALVTLIQRRLGLILSPTNPHSVHALEDLAGSGLRFANRQPGSGTRVWLEMVLRKAGLSPEDIKGYSDEKMTHSAVAQAVAEQQADVGLGLETAAINFGLDFVELTQEPYELVIPESVMRLDAIQRMLEWLKTSRVHDLIENLGGYDASQTGQVRWVS
jgi:molybdate-binding protein/DNA-binding transcriptional regulator YhcF (GntR family)